jgi:hypothetical protein
MTISNTNLSFIGKDEDIDNEYIFKIYDTNYINLKNLPIAYYPIYNKKFLVDNLFSKIDDTRKTIRGEFDFLIKEMENDKNIYNYYLITPISIIISIIWIFFLLFILKYIHYYYNIYYIYIITTIIICLLIFGSLWFIYVNNQLL